jgi:hypothetical protein
MISTIMLTNCTSRKRYEAAADMCGRSIDVGTIQEIADEWLARLPKSGTVAPADLYAGRSIQIARRAADTLSAHLYVLSAGYGLVGAGDRLTPYNLTVSGETPDNVVARSTDGTAQKWWAAIRGRGARLDRLKAQNCILAALSSHYLDMIADDLEEIARRDQARLVLFVAESNARHLPAHLRDLVMPYGRSLDSANSPVRGTGTDAVQRQMLHFASSVMPTLPKRWTVQKARVEVTAFASKRTPEARRQGTSATDDEVLLHIREARSLGLKSWTAALRFLRNEQNVACAQDRFITLFNAPADAMGYACLTRAAS